MPACRLSLGESTLPAIPEYVGVPSVSTGFPPFRTGRVVEEHPSLQDKARALPPEGAGSRGVPVAMAVSGDAAGTRSGPTEREASAARMKRRRACLELGQRKEDFELQGLLGQGSYAHVYKARSRHSGRKVGPRGC